MCEYTSWQLIKFAWIVYVTYRFDSQVEFSSLIAESQRRTRLCQNEHPPTTNAMAKSLVPFIIAETSWLPILELFWWPAKEWGNRHCARLARDRPRPRRGSCHKKYLRDFYVTQWSCNKSKDLDYLKENLYYFLNAICRKKIF